MRKLNFSLLDWIILGIFLSSITLDVFWNFLTSFLDVILFSNHFTNPYNFTKFITSNTTFLCKIIWLNKLILLIAGFIPSIILHFALNDLSIPNWLNYVLNILLYYIVLQLFSSRFFWISIAIILLSYITYKITIHIKNKKSKIKKV